MTAYTIENATVVDGRGAPAFRGNVCFEDDRIASVGGHERLGRVIDASGLVVAPGFVDIHSHVDWIAPLPDGAELARRRTSCRASRPSVAGNCGISPAPLGRAIRGAARSSGCCSSGSSPASSAGAGRAVAEYLREIERRGLPLNIALFVGHSTLRATVLGGAARARDRRASSSRCGRCSTQGLARRSVGLSVGLEYFPGRYAGPSEVAELARVAAAQDAGSSPSTPAASPSSTTRRSTRRSSLAAGSRCRLQISHVNPMGRANWDGIDGLFERVDARARGRPGRRLRHRSATRRGR